jgi:hypothetical protein
VYVPASLDTVVKLTPVPSLVSVTVAPGMRDAVESVTTPVTREVVPCAAATVAMATRSGSVSQHGTLRHMVCMESPLT